MMFLVGSSCFPCVYMWIALYKMIKFTNLWMIVCVCVYEKKKLRWFYFYMFWWWFICVSEGTHILVRCVYYEVPSVPETREIIIIMDVLVSCMCDMETMYVMKFCGSNAFDTKIHCFYYVCSSVISLSFSQ